MSGNVPSSRAGGLSCLRGRSHGCTRAGHCGCNRAEACCGTRAEARVAPEMLVGVAPQLELASASEAEVVKLRRKLQLHHSQMSLLHQSRSLLEPELASASDAKVMQGVAAAPEPKLAAVRWFRVAPLLCLSWWGINRCCLGFRADTISVRNYYP